MRHRPAHPRAFTLIELVTVLTLMGIVAASALPALSTLNSTRLGAAGAEIKRTLQRARSTAAASGRPTGVRISSSSNLTMVQIPTVGAGVSTLTSLFGTPEPVISLPNRFSGARLSRSALGSGETGDVTFWFRFDGTPQSRSNTGVLGATWTADGSVEVNGGPRITVRRVTGAIE